MKFLHISDLHIGKYVNGYRMLDDQRYMLERIIEIIKEKNPDALLIAGDIYSSLSVTFSFFAFSFLFPVIIL